METATWDISGVETPRLWSEGRVITVTGPTDLFHDDLHYEDIDRVFMVMAACPQHRFEILTDNPDRARMYLQAALEVILCAPEPFKKSRFGENAPAEWPLPNVSLGVALKSQDCAIEKVGHLLHAPAAERFVRIHGNPDHIDLTSLPHSRGRSGRLRIFDATTQVNSCDGAEANKIDRIVIA